MISKLAKSCLNNVVIFPVYSSLFLLYDASHRMWDIWDVGCLGFGMLGIWDVWDGGCSGCDMFRIFDVWDAKCLGCFGY